METVLLQSVDFNLESKEQLSTIYMPFLKNGGIIIPVNNATMGEKISVKIKLWNGESIEFSGIVVWINTNSTQSPKLKGIGVKITGDNESAIKQKLEKLLASS